MRSIDQSNNKDSGFRYSQNNTPAIVTYKQN